MTAANALAAAAERGFPAVVNALEASEQAWILLRVSNSESELCALVERPDERLDDLLRGKGFVPFRDPRSNGHTVHVAYDVAHDTWTRVRLYGRIPVGPRGERGANLTSALLARSEPLDGVRVLSPADAFWYAVLELTIGRGSNRPDADALVDLSDAAPTASPLREEVAAIDPALPDRITKAATGGDTAALRTLLRTLAESNRSRQKPVREPGDGMKPRGCLRMRDRGFTIAVLGPDGAGKTTLARGLVDSLPLESRYVYLGMWQRSTLRRLLAPIPGARFLLVVAKLLARSSRIAAHRRLGRIVVVDRFTYDADVPSTADWKSRTSAKILRRLTREPELAILLDARPEVMFARKGEHDPTRLGELRNSYLRMAQSEPRLAVLDAGEPPESVRRKATALIWDRLRSADADPQRQVRRR